MKKLLIIIIVAFVIAKVFGLMSEDETAEVSQQVETQDYTREYVNPYSGSSYYGNGGYGGNFSPYDFKSECPDCDGTGKKVCSVCKGSGKNEIYDSLSPVLKGFEKKYCVTCNGTGYITCGRCNGTGMN